MSKCLYKLNKMLEAQPVVPNPVKGRFIISQEREKLRTHATTATTKESSLYLKFPFRVGFLPFPRLTSDLSVRHLRCGTHSGLPCHSDNFSTDLDGKDSYMAYMARRLAAKR